MNATTSCDSASTTDSSLVTSGRAIELDSLRIQIMAILLLLLIVAITFAALGLPLLVVSFCLLCKYKKETFLRIRGLQHKYFLLGVALLFAEIFVPIIFLYTYFYNSDLAMASNTIDKTNEYFLLIHQTLFVAINISALVQRYYHFSKFKLRSLVIQ